MLSLRKILKIEVRDLLFDLSVDEKSITKGRIRCLRVALLLKTYFNLSCVNLCDLLFVYFYEVVSLAASASHHGCDLREEVWPGRTIL